MSPALALLVACCRWPDDERRGREITLAANDIGDWDEVVRLAGRHRVEPLVMHGLSAAKIAIPPALASATARFAASSLRDVAETLRIATALDRAGIEHRFLKGAALGVVAFGSPLLKRSWDMDILVDPQNAVAAATILSRLDYRPVMPPRHLDQIEFDRWQRVSKEAEFRSPRGSTVELHWRVSDHPQLLANVTASSPARRVALLGAHEVATFADDVNLAYLAVHGTGHAWFRLKWIADFHALLNSIPPAQRDAVLSRAGALAVGRTLDTALMLAGRLFDDAATPTGNATALLTAVSLAALSEINEDVAIGMTGSLRWRLAPGIVFRCNELAIRLRGTLDRIDHPLPPGWAFLYPLFRLPFWINRLARRRGIERRH